MLAVCRLLVYLIKVSDDNGPHRSYGVMLTPGIMEKCTSTCLSSKLRYRHIALENYRSVMISFRFFLVHFLFVLRYDSLLSQRLCSLVLMANVNVQESFTLSLAGHNVTFHAGHWQWLHLVDGQVDFSIPRLSGATFSVVAPSMSDSLM